ncbi:MAG: transglycosylase SLT domain-containing protein [Anaerolineae bacterium]
MSSRNSKLQGITYLQVFAKKTGWVACIIGILILLGCGNQPSPPATAVAVTNLDEAPALDSVTSLPPTPTLNPAVAADLDQFEAVPDQSALVAATPTPLVSPTPLPTPTPTRVLPPNELLDAGLRQIELGNTALAASYFQQLLDSPTGEPELVEIAKYNMGIALVTDDFIDEARAIWIDYTQNSASIDPAVWYRLAEIEQDPATAEQYLLTFVESHPELGPYVYPKLAKLNPAQAESYYLSGLNEVAWYRQTIAIRRQLADLYLREQRYEEAIVQFEAIRAAAFTDNTKGEMTWRIGETWSLADNNQMAVDTWQFGLNEYPTAYESYLGLVELVDNEVPVDAFQRGLVDYNVGVYGPAIDVFNGYIAANPENYRADTHLFLAWSLEQTNQTGLALAELDTYLRLAPEDVDVIGRYYIEKAALETRSISTEQAVETLTDFISNYPDHPEMPFARWRRAILADRFMLRSDLAIPFYEEFVTFHPQDENASASLLRLGVLQDAVGNGPAAVDAWKRAAKSPDQNGRAGLVWLIRNNQPISPTLPALASVAAAPSNYYSLRVQALQTDQVDVPYSTADLNLNIDPVAEQAETEQWLAQTFGRESVSSTLPPNIAGDGRLIRGRNLWRIGEYDAAKWELESLRQSYSEDPITSYQLAIAFRDIGLYRSSILAANNVLIRAGESAFSAPKGIGRLVYPIYYGDLILPLADEYGYDPLLYFALVRQESLFEGFATSSAYAQGLGQIIPDTGNFVAQRLAWEGYENADLYRPYVNLTFGAYYFDQQLDLFDGFYPAALAAYNGGPGNAIRWYDEAGPDFDLFLETINFSETRLYLRTIYPNYQVYRYLYGPES